MYSNYGTATTSEVHSGAASIGGSFGMQSRPSEVHSLHASLHTNNTGIGNNWSGTTAGACAPMHNNNSNPNNTMNSNSIHATLNSNNNAYHGMYSQGIVHNRPAVPAYPPPAPETMGNLKIDQQHNMNKLGAPSGLPQQHHGGHQHIDYGNSGSMIGRMSEVSSNSRNSIYLGGVDVDAMSTVNNCNASVIDAAHLTENNHQTLDQALAENWGNNNNKTNTNMRTSFNQWTVIAEQEKMNTNTSNSNIKLPSWQQSQNEIEHTTKIFNAGGTSTNPSNNTNFGFNNNMNNNTSTTTTTMTTTGNTGPAPGGGNGAVLGGGPVPPHHQVRGHQQAPLYNDKYDNNGYNNNNNNNNSYNNNAQSHMSNNTRAHQNSNINQRGGHQGAPGYNNNYNNNAPMGNKGGSYNNHGNGAPNGGGYNNNGNKGEPMHGYNSNNYNGDNKGHNNMNADHGSHNMNGGYSNGYNNKGGDHNHNSNGGYNNNGYNNKGDNGKGHNNHGNGNYNNNSNGNNYSNNNNYNGNKL